MASLYQRLCLLVPSEIGKESDWKTTEGGWDAKRLRCEVDTVEKSYFDVEFPEKINKTGLIFDGWKIVGVETGSVSARMSLRAGLYLVRIGSHRATHKFSTAIIKNLIRIQLKTSKPFKITCRPATAREEGRKGSAGGGEVEMKQKGAAAGSVGAAGSAAAAADGLFKQKHLKPTEGTSPASRAQLSRLKEEISSLKRQLETEKTLRKNEQEQTELWKQLMNGQIEELERASDAKQAQLQLVQAQKTQAEKRSKKFRKAEEKSKLELHEAKCRIGKLEENLVQILKERDEKNDQIRLLEKEKEQVNSNLSAQKDQLDDITRMFNSSQKLMVTAHKKIENLESQLKEAKNSELSRQLKEKEDQVIRYKKRMEDLVRISGTAGGTGDPLGVGLGVKVEDKESEEPIAHGRVVLLTSHCAGILEKSQQDRLRHLFDALGYKYREIDGADSPEIRKQLVERSGKGSYPQVFISSSSSSGSGSDDAGCYVFMGDFNTVFEINERGRIHAVFRGCERRYSGSIYF